MSTLIVIPAYLFSSVALAISAGRGITIRLVGFLAAIAMVYIAGTAAPGDALLALVLVLATAPLFVLNRRKTTGTTQKATAATIAAEGD